MDLFHNELVLDATKSKYELLKLYPFQFKILKHFRGSQQTWNGQNKIIKDPMNTVYFVLDGDGYISTNGKKIELLPNHVYMIPTNCARQYGCRNFIEKYWSFFQMRSSLGIDFFDGKKEIIDFGPVLNQKGVKDLFQDVSLFKLLAIQNLIYDLIDSKGMLEKVDLIKSRKLEPYLKIIKYIEENLSAKITTTYLAQMLQMTPQGFSRAFHRDVGITIKQYLSEKLNQKASDMVLLTDLKIKEIAHKLGYGDEYYFIRFFKKMNKLSPTQYRSR